MVLNFKICIKDSKIVSGKGVYTEEFIPKGAVFWELDDTCAVIFQNGDQFNEYIKNKTKEEIDRENQSQIEAKWYSAKFKRNNLLKESDIEILPDKWENMDLSVKAAWSLYRLQLRDIPQTFSNPDEIIWPTKP